MELFGKKISLTTQIFIAMILGAILGLIFGLYRYYLVELR